MLFSSSEVATFIDDTFEPAWESVRPAPLVTIDFGNGHVVKRTLQGNVATYVCGADGTIYDVLPGIYAPDVYRKQLAACRDLVASLQPRLGAKPPPTEAEGRRIATNLADRLRDYHTRQAKLSAIAPPPSAPMIAIAAIGGGFKGGSFAGGGLQINGFAGHLGTGFPAGSFGGGGFQFGGGIAGRGIGGPGAMGGIEGPTERVIAGLPPVPGAGGMPSVPLAARPELRLDSEVNERIRRKAVHEELARRGLVRPDDLKKWLYKDVLHADLDDPMLGLGPVLNANYPFAEEDRAAGGKK